MSGLSAERTEDEESGGGGGGPCPSKRIPCQTGDARWTLLRFSVLCLLAVLILITVYAGRSSGGSTHGEKTEDLYGVGDPIYPRNLWLIIELPSDSLGLRTSLGKKSIEHVCGAVRAGQAVKWTPLVIGGKSECCRSHCHHLAPTDIPKMNHSISKYYLDTKADVTTALRTAGFLQAIEKGAHFIFHASPEVYFSAGVSPSVYSRELEHQLRRMTLGISIGLLSVSPGSIDPYSHFGLSKSSSSSSKAVKEEEEADVDDAPYRICELRPPSLEKFLDSDGLSTDPLAPPLTVSGGSQSPFDSRNTLFSRDAFLGLLMLPGITTTTRAASGGGGSPGKKKEEAAFLRSILAQALLKVLAGSTKFSISKETLTFDLKNKSMELGKELSEIQSLLKDWDCSNSGANSAFSCMRELLNYVAEETGHLREEHLEMADKWLSDLSSVGYNDFPSVPSSSSPCIGSDSLPGVLFRASQPPQAGPLSRFCPSLDFSKKKILSPPDPTSDILLIVSFTGIEEDYESIALFQTVYQPAFGSILYCGPPGQGAEELYERVRANGGSGFSFLPVVSGQAYECALGAIEMGYNVEGLLVVTSKTFITSWSFQGLDKDIIWHGNKHAEVMDAEAIRGLNDTSKASKIIGSVNGLVETFNFIAKVLDSAASSTGGRQDGTNRSNIIEPPLVEEGGGPPVSDVTRDYPIEEEEENRGGLGGEHLNDKEGEPSDRATVTTGGHSGLHLNIFGEINDDANDGSALSGLHVNKNLTEAIFRPANFKETSPFSHFEGALPHIAQDLESLQQIYGRILEKLKVLEASGESCNESLNPEICRLVNTFFRVLRGNDGETFRLVYDDLPIYYVPLRNMLKDELYLMANLFTKYSVDNEIAFPLLLRGLSPQDSWFPLVQSFLQEDFSSVDSLEDLLQGVQGDGQGSNGSEEAYLQQLEASHYIYPLNMTFVLRNEAIRNMICKRF